MAEVTRTVTASAGSASYDVLIGSSILPAALARKELDAFERVAVFASARVYGLHSDYIDESLAVLGDRRMLILYDDSEENKNYARAGEFLEKFISMKMNRKSAVIGIGGGVTGDFAGFCAGVYMRGVPVMHVPTTLLAMVDSSLGGKVAVNLSVGKNIVGLFHQPSLVVSDVRFLETLPDSEFRNGLSEALKHALIGEPYTLGVLERNDLASIRKEGIVADLVAHSVAFKTGVVERDERENDLRAILNFGHTIGHAIESHLGFRGVSHGEAVAAGMSVKAEISRRLGFITDEEAEQVRAVIGRYGLMREQWGLDVDGIIGHMEYDKKNFGGAINFVLLKGLGKPFINQRIPVDLLKEVMMNVVGA
jgi:3-dehydroquinate synthase